MAGSHQGLAESRIEATERELSRASGETSRIWNSRNRNQYQKQDQSRRFHGRFLRAVSRRNWLHLIALGGFLAVALFSKSVLAKDDNSKHQEETDHASYTIQQASPKLGPLPFKRKEPAKTDWANPECNKPKDHDEADLCIQKQMAHTAKNSLFSNYIQIGLGVIGAGLLLWTLRYTKRATDSAVASAKAAQDSASAARAQIAITERNTKLESRAYVHIEEISIPDGNLENDVTIVIKFKNFGNTPAYRVTVRAGATHNSGREPDFSFSEKSPLYYSLGPGQDHVTTLSYSILLLQLIRHDLLKKGKTFYVFGEVLYFDAFQDQKIEEPRFTRFRSELILADDGIAKGTFVFSDEGNEAS